MLCQAPAFPHTTLMRTSRHFALLSISAFSVILSSCGGIGGGTTKNPGGTGPFDRNGNYVEAWADNPSKWGKRSSPTSTPDDIPPSIASNEQPPSNAVPLSDSPPVKPSKPTRSGEVEVASRNKLNSKPVEVATNSRSNSKTRSRESEQTVKVKPKSSESTKSKSSATAKSTKSKSSSSTRYVVKSGDSLSSIASRTGSSVSAIQKANGISGTLIHPGKSLVIPK